MAVFVLLSCAYSELYGTTVYSTALHCIYRMPTPPGTIGDTWHAGQDTHLRFDYDLEREENQGMGKFSCPREMCRSIRTVVETFSSFPSSVYFFIH
jgi:hypothetical protein